MNIKVISFLSIFLILAISDGSAQINGNQCILKSEFIFQPEDVPFPSCHASTIIQDRKGLITAWFGGTRERDPDVCIWASRFSKGKWSKPVMVADGIQFKGKRYPCWNPVLFNTGKDIILFYKVGPSPSQWWGEMKISYDRGKTWSKACRLPEDIIGPVKNKPVLLENGYLICPSSSENDGWRIHMEFTADNGITWERTPPLNEKETGAIQPSVLVHRNGKLQLLCRSTVSSILTAWSDDMGHTWSKLTPLALPNPNSGIDAVTLSDGRHLLVYNHLERGRNSLHVAVSDDGLNWKAAAILENDEKGKEYSYPAVIQSDDGLVHITYTWNRKQIRHVVINADKIVPRPMPDRSWPE